MRITEKQKRRYGSIQSTEEQKRNYEHLSVFCSEDNIVKKSNGVTSKLVRRNTSPA